MASLVVLLGGPLALIVALVVKLQLKARRRTENFDGQEIERQAREAIPAHPREQHLGGGPQPVPRRWWRPPLVTGRPRVRPVAGAGTRFR
ncbi:hypothetical protein ACIA8E_08800 [Streptomyces sp. NPDC051664]|uniref:hypothetical protein n=1 Tax=Streptomyces sp. NPDC051664 TaxID=3365668 RepID=UPI0037B7C0A9